MTRIAVMGATGLVGQEIINVLFNRMPNCSLRVFASSRSAGKIISTGFGDLTVEDAEDVDYSDFDIAFFAIGGEWPRMNAEKATSKGCVVIDNSSSFRYDDLVPLVVPEINGDSIGNSLLIANPNCTTAILALPLWHIHKKYGLKRVIVSTYQAASGAGKEAVDELLTETRSVLDGDSAANKVFLHPLPFNIIPQIDSFQDNLYTREEMKVTWETRKIFGEPNLKISCTAVRIPVIRAHSESVTVQTEKEVSADDVRDMLSHVDGVEVEDDPSNNSYPMPINSTGKYDVKVGRIRQSLVFEEYGLDFFICGDQLLRGAALNAVLIAERIASQSNKSY